MVVPNENGIIQRKVGDAEVSLRNKSKGTRRFHCSETIRFPCKIEIYIIMLIICIITNNVQLIKMSSIIIDLKTTGFGNQIKTKIINLDNIANALRINPDRLVAIISEDIGTKVNTDNEFNGKITNQDIKNVLYKNNLL